MTALIKPITALLMSASIILAANGLEGVLLPLRGVMERFSDLEIGLIGSAYFAGFTLGCLTCPRIIARVGHIRAFTVFTAVTAVSPLIEAMWPEPPLWWCFRAVTGVCFAGILNVFESWLTSVATNANRGQLMGTYAFINFASLTLGQQLINLGSPADFRLFSLVAILCSLAAVPLALTLSPPPAPPLRPRLQLRRIYEVSPAAVAGCLGAGLANGAFWALAPVYARDSGLPDFQVAAFVSLVLVGGALAQWPIGRISDRMDRRLVLAMICAVAALIGMMLFLLPDAPLYLRLSLAALFGACALPVILGLLRPRQRSRRAGRSGQRQQQSAAAVRAGRDHRSDRGRAAEAAVRGGKPVSLHGRDPCAGGVHRALPDDPPVSAAAAGADRLR